MKLADPKWAIVGQGLAGTCVAWALWKRGESFRLLDRGVGGSSRVAAGMVNPITGKNFEPSWRIADFLPEALEFYAEIEQRIGRKIWHSYPVLRLAESEKEWEKIRSKMNDATVAAWVAGEVQAPPGWVGAVTVQGGGRLDTLAFMEGSRDFFREAGIVQEEEVCEDSARGDVIWCDGAAGLLGGRYGPHRCAKGEILTIYAAAWDESQIRVGAGGWLVPLGGGGLFKVGSTYEWRDLDEIPTEKGRLRVEEIARKLGGDAFEVLRHDAGVRPILRRSQPLIGRMGDREWMLNALGSKGALYAPRMAHLLVCHLLDGIEPEPEFSVQHFLNETPR